MSAVADSWKAIIERMRAFAEGHYLIPDDENGNKPFTYGQSDVADLLKSPVYPLMHVTPMQLQFDPVGKMMTYTMEIIFADLPNRENDKEDHVTDVLSDTARLCADLVATIHNGTNDLFDRSIKIGSVVTADPFIDETGNALSGHRMSLSLDVPSNYSFCDVPAGFNLNAGDSGSGGNFSAKYLKNIAVAGQSTVASTQPADTFTFVNGDGMVITTNATTKTITFTPKNFGNANLTFTGDRVHDADGNDLTINDVATWQDNATVSRQINVTDGATFTADAILDVNGAVLSYSDDVLGSGGTVSISNTSTATSFQDATGGGSVDVSHNVQITPDPVDGELRLQTVDVQGGNADVGMVPELINALTGETEFRERARMVLTLSANVFNPVDATTVYLGQIGRQPTTVAAVSKVYVRIACTLIHVEINMDAGGTAGSSEAISAYIRVNNTTDYLIATVSLATRERIFHNTAMNTSGIVFAPGDYFEVKFVFPTWATNPTTVGYGGYAYLI
jgi:hypothetical protein